MRAAMLAPAACRSLRRRRRGGVLTAANFVRSDAKSFSSERRRLSEQNKLGFWTFRLSSDVLQVFLFTLILPLLKQEASWMSKVSGCVYSAALVKMFQPELGRQCLSLNAAGSHSTKVSSGFFFFHSAAETLETFASLVKIHIYIFFNQL